MRRHIMRGVGWANIPQFSVGGGGEQQIPLGACLSYELGTSVCIMLSKFSGNECRDFFASECCASFWPHWYHGKYALQATAVFVSISMKMFNRYRSWRRSPSSGIHSNNCTCWYSCSYQTCKTARAANGVPLPPGEVGIRVSPPMGTFTGANTLLNLDSVKVCSSFCC